MSITYGAGGSTRDTTVAVTERVATETTLLPMAHLTAVNHSVAELRNVIGRLAGGRHPQHPRGARRPARQPAGRVGAAPARACCTPPTWCGWSGSRATSRVGVAAFPYKHPRSPDIETDTAQFVRKCRAGADFAITQMFFDGDDYLRLRDRVAAAGCDTPILAGVMPVTTLRTIERSEQLSGAPFPRHLAAQFERIADDPAAVRRLGIEQASEMCDAAARRGRAGHPLHHPQPVDRDPRDLAAPAGRRGGLSGAVTERRSETGTGTPSGGRRCTAGTTRGGLAAGPRLAAARRTASARLLAAAAGAAVGR